MSMTSARKVVGRAVLDAGFRASLFNSPAKALEGYDLTADEFAALCAIPADILDGFAHQLEEWIALSLLAYGAEDGAGLSGAAWGEEGAAGGGTSSNPWLAQLASALDIRGNAGVGG